MSRSVLVVVAFKNKGWTTYSVDLRKNEQASHALIITGQDVQGDVKRLTDELHRLNACGWAGGSAGSDDFFATLDRMWKFNVQSAAATAHIAAKALKEGGLVVLTGAAAALGPTPTMLSYGITKAATHQIIKSLAAEGGGLPKGASVVGVAPIVLDTATNRKDMPNANFDDWTPLPTIADLLTQWADNKGRPASGKLLKIVTKAKHTTAEEAHF